MLTNAQKQTLRTNLFANTDPEVILYVSGDQAGNIVGINGWYKKASTTLAWGIDVQPMAALEAPDYSLFDSIVAGKRDSWRIFITVSHDFSKNKVRKWITDVWGSATAGSNAEAILQAGTEFATREQAVFGGNSASTGTVTAIKRTFDSAVGFDEWSEIWAMGAP